VGVEESQRFKPRWWHWLKGEARGAKKEAKNEGEEDHSSDRSDEINSRPQATLRLENDI